MSRLVKEIEIEGRAAVALFDTAVGRSYVRRDLIANAPTCVLTEPYRIRFGEKRIEIREVCLAFGEIDGLDFDFEAEVIDDLDPADGQRLDAIIGSFVMNRWEIRIDPESGGLDLEGLRRREFTEYWEPLPQRPEAIPPVRR
jgi:hypothetical protein